MKDVPMDMPPGYALAAIAEREDPRDAFVSARYAGLDALPAGAWSGLPACGGKASCALASPI